MADPDSKFTLRRGGQSYTEQLCQQMKGLARGGVRGVSVRGRQMPGPSRRKGENTTVGVTHFLAFEVSASSSPLPWEPPPSPRPSLRGEATALSPLLDTDLSKTHSVLPAPGHSSPPDQFETVKYCPPFSRKEIYCIYSMKLKFLSSPATSDPELSRPALGCTGATSQQCLTCPIPSYTACFLSPY